MHRCLSLPEILSLICADLGFDSEQLEDGTSQYLGTLASMATTSRAFCKPALDTLWRGIHTIMPLLRCMPSDLWDERAGRLYLRRPLESTDWVRFDYYAPRVRSLGFEYGPNTSPGLVISEEVYSALAFSRQTTLLCPKLRNLCWDKKLPFQYTRLFIGEELVLFDIELDLLSMADLSILAFLPVMHPRMKQVYLSYDTDEGEPCESVVKTVEQLACGWSNLEEFVCDVVLSTSAVIHLATTQTLKYTKISLSGDFADFRSSFDPHTKPFHMLDELRIIAKRIESCTFLLDLISSCRLEHVEIICYDDCNATALEHFIHMLHARCPAHLLKTFKLFGQIEQPLNSEHSSTVQADMLKPLLLFRDMKKILVDARYSFDLGNTMLEEMAIAWPNLTQLQLGSCGWQGQSRITLKGLLPLLALPKLASLAIVVDASIVDYSLEEPALMLPNRIHTIDLGDSKIEDAQMVAAFMSAMLPHLEEIIAWEENINASTLASYSVENAKMFRARWKEVSQLIPIFAGVRKSDRKCLELEG